MSVRANQRLIVRTVRLFMQSMVGMQTRNPVQPRYLDSNRTRLKPTRSLKGGALLELRCQLRLQEESNFKATLSKMLSNKSETNIWKSETNRTRLKHIQGSKAALLKTPSFNPKTNTVKSEEPQYLRSPQQILAKSRKTTVMNPDSSST